MANLNTGPVREPITRVDFSGSADFTINGRKVEADKNFTVKKLGSRHLLFESSPSGGNIINVGNFTFSGNKFSGVSMGSNSNSISVGNTFGAIRSGGLSIQQNGHETIINGHPYKIYVPKKGVHKGKSIYLPEGFKIVDDEGNNMDNQTTSSPPAEEGTKSYDFEANGQFPFISEIECNGATNVKAGEIFDQERVKMTLNGASELSFLDSVIAKEVTATTNGSSSLVFGAIVEKAVLHSNGASQIKGLRVTGELEAKSNGASSMHVFVKKGVSVEKSVYGASEITICRV
jgi:hypothetical protein